MKLLNRQESESKITQYAKDGRSFFFAIDFLGTSALVMTPEEAHENGIFYSINGINNFPDYSSNLAAFSFSVKPVSIEVYRKSFEKVMAALNNGDTYLLNLTFPTKINTSLTPAEIFHHSQAKYKLLLPGKFVVFSPETFIRIHENRIYSCPMKGTISAAIPDAEEIILADRKELYEHNTIVDLIRNDLSMVSTHVMVKRFRYVERIKSLKEDLLQVSSEISGELPDDYRDSLGSLLFKLLPAGSVSGAPKKSTVDIILDSEIYQRGFYTGIFGYYDGRSLDSGVMIRFIELTGEGLVYKSGGGITALSDLTCEYEEMIQKVYVPVV
jgi:para-aminobenzoate synthetase component I